MTEHDDPFKIQSAWGAIAAFFLVQCFGFVTLQAFRMFVSIAVHGSDKLSPVKAYDVVARVMLPFWGLMWIFFFVAFQIDIFRRISNFARNKGMVFFLRSLKAPTEVLKLVLAALFGAVYVWFLLGHYPFPSHPISTIMGTLFGAFSWGVSALFAWGMKKPPPAQKDEKSTRVGSILGFLIGAMFFAAACFLKPEIFYFHGMVGLGVMTGITCHVLFRGAGVNGRSGDTILIS